MIPASEGFPQSIMAFSTVRSIVNNFPSNFTIELKKKEGCMGKKVSEEDATFIQKFRRPRLYHNHKNGTNKTLHETNLSIPCSTISRFLKMKYSRKRITRICMRSLEPKREHIRVLFVTKLIQ